MAKVVVNTLVKHNRHRTTALTVRTGDDFLMRQNQECSLKSTSLDGIALTVPGRSSYMLTVERLSVALRKQSNCHPIPAPFLNQKPMTVH